MKSFSGQKMTKTIKTKQKKPHFSNFCLVAQNSGIIPLFQMESVRRFLKRLLKKKAKVFFRVSPTNPITKKPNDVRLGKGKGNIKY